MYSSEVYVLRYRRHAHHLDRREAAKIIASADDPANRRLPTARHEKVTHPPEQDPLARRLGPAETKTPGVSRRGVCDDRNDE
jgi:hypothetical protein